jgi:hypothetical protein
LAKIPNPLAILGSHPDPKSRAKRIQLKLEEDEMETLGDKTVPKDRKMIVLKFPKD